MSAFRLNAASHSGQLQGTILGIRFPPNHRQHRASRAMLYHSPTFDRLGS